MINYTDIQRYENLAFDKYQALPGYSHSFLKREVNGIATYVEPSEKIRLGSLVDKILTDPTSADMRDELWPRAKEIAAAVKASFGGVISQFKAQLSYTGMASYKGFAMPVCGRLDWLLEQHAVIDLKVTEAPNVQRLIAYMGYDNQLWNYTRLAGVSKAYLFIYSTKLKKCFDPIKVDCSMPINEFWADKIQKFGTVIE